MGGGCTWPSHGWKAFLSRNRDKVNHKESESTVGNAQRCEASGSSLGRPSTINHIQELSAPKLHRYHHSHGNESFCKGFAGKAVQKCVHFAHCHEVIHVHTQGILTKYGPENAHSAFISGMCTRSSKATWDLHVHGAALLMRPF